MAVAWSRGGGGTVAIGVRVGVIGLLVEFVKSMKLWRFSCYAHIIGTENHEAQDDAVRVVVSAPDYKTAYARAMEKAVSIWRSRYGNGFHAQHCNGGQL